MTDEEIEKTPYFAVIPANVRYDDKLSATSKLLLVDIINICWKSDDCVCRVSNKAFAKLYGTTTSTITRWLKPLKEGNYIKIDYGHKMPAQRIIRLGEALRRHE